MMKKLSYAVAAFVLGVLLSVTINACGGDKEGVEPGETQTPGQTPGSGGGGTTGGGREINNWELRKISLREEYFEDGRLEIRDERKYNEKGWEIEQKNVQYTNSSYYYKYSEYTTNYTYSPDGDYRTGVTVLTLYNEDGSIRLYQRTNFKEYVYQQ